MKKMPAFNNLLRYLLNLVCFALVLEAKITSSKFQNTLYAKGNEALQSQENYGGNSSTSFIRRPSWASFQRMLETARLNTASGDTQRTTMPLGERHFELSSTQSAKTQKVGDTPGPFDPSQPGQPFTLDTLNGPVKFPSDLLPNNSNTPIIFHTFNNHSGFLEALWTDSASLRYLITESPDNTHYLFMSTGEDGYADALWMRGQIKSAMWDAMDIGEIKPSRMSELLSHMHFVTTSVFELGNWIPTLLNNWACQDHGCGLSQAKFTNDTTSASGEPIILKRLDAHYDWLPSPSVVFKDKSVRVVLSEDGCSKDAGVAEAIAVVMDGNCDFYDKMGFMQRSKALGVIVYAKSGQAVQDMNCGADECDQMPPSIPGTMIPYNRELITMLQAGSVNVTFQTTTTSNFYFAIDGQGLLAEMGWLLYPSFQFFAWQAQWFNYKTMLQSNLSEQALVLPVVNSSIMVGEKGIVTTIKLPKITEIFKYKKVELDASLSCPGTRDETCPPWDHIMSLYVCCDNTSTLCGMEIGRWITPFRRRIGRWLTDITPLLPLFTSETCTFTMKLDAFWAQPWKPSLNLRFSDYVKKPSSKDVHPYQIIPLFQGGTFNKSYNSHYRPVNFTVPAGTTKVEIVAVITGHGSDENGCGEFCVTSHHFVVNGDRENVRTYSKAGTLEGCADGTPITGVEPNEHGTWLYGRNGWCNGREVDPWVIDITSQVSQEGGVTNSVTYFGWYKGGDPDPKSEPGYIVMYSYLVYYRSFITDQVL